MEGVRQQEKRLTGLLIGVCILLSTQAKHHLSLPNLVDDFGEFLWGDVKRDVVVDWKG